MFGIALALLLVFVAALFPVACADRAESRFVSEYGRLHAETPEDMLKAGELSLDEAMAIIEAGVDPDVPVVRARWLPAGLQVAAPFRGTGSGAALPNPQVWGSGWALSLTDGRSRITLVVGADEEFAGNWTDIARDADGTIRIQRRGELLLVRVEGENGSVTLIAERLGEERLLHIVDNLEWSS